MSLVSSAPVRESAAAVVRRNGRLLLLQRTGPPQPGAWGLPAGKIDHGELPEAAAARELREETGLIGRSTRLLGIKTTVVAGELWRAHYFRVECVGEGMLVEPTKHARLGWFAISGLPSPLFQPLAEYLAAGGRLA
jgi:8-oxo-dGTP diphosphatase